MGPKVRDYIHVVDLPNGYIVSVQKLLKDSKIGCEVYKLGIGKGTSVLEMVRAFEKASGKNIPLTMSERRPGDAEVVYASAAKAEEELNWKQQDGSFGGRRSDVPFRASFALHDAEHNLAWGDCKLEGLCGEGGFSTSVLVAYLCCGFALGLCCYLLQAAILCLRQASSLYSRRSQVHIGMR